MKIIKKIIPLLLCSLIFILATAQKRVIKKSVPVRADTVKPKPKINILLPNVYLGHSDFNGGKIKKYMFDSLMKQGITSKDSLGNEYKAIAFYFTYIERNLYEDSMANLVIIPDYTSDYCLGDTLSLGMANVLYNRTKPGDTAIIEKVKLVKRIKETGDYLPDSMAILGKAVKCVIIK